MNCLLIGLGSYAQSVYLKFFHNEKVIDNVSVVDLVSEQARVMHILNAAKINYDLLLLDDDIRALSVLSQDVEIQLMTMIEKNNIEKVVIATPQHSHKMYVDFCLKHNLDIIYHNSVLSALQLNPFIDLREYAIPYMSLNARGEFNFMNDEAIQLNSLRTFFTSRKSYVNVAENERVTHLLTSVQTSIAKKYKTDDFRFSVEALIKHKGKFLICQRNNDAKVAPGIWNVPAGKVQYDESLTDALVRETLEETSLTLDNIQYIDYKFINKKHKRIVYTYFCEVHAIKAFTIDKSEFSTWHWINADEVDNYESLSPHLKSWIKYLAER